MCVLITHHGRFFFDESAPALHSSRPADMKMRKNLWEKRLFSLTGVENKGNVLVKFWPFRPSLTNLDSD